MKRLRKVHWGDWLACVLVAAVLNWTTGCATIFSGTSQTVRVVTTPPGKTVYYQGMSLKDGQMFTVQKHFREPQFNVGTTTRPIMTPMNYDPDPWLIGDAALFLLGILPGVVALGVDFGTGSWRNLNDPQNVYARE